MKLLLSIMQIAVSTLAVAQLHLNYSLPDPEVMLKSGLDDKVWKLPTVTSSADVLTPIPGMLVYDKTSGGIIGFEQGSTASEHWTNLYISENSLNPFSETTTLASYSRGTVEGYVEMTGLQTDIDVEFGGQLITVQFENQISFTHNCFRGNIKIDIEYPVGTVKETINQTFNFGGVTGVTTQVPYQLILRTVADYAGTYRVRVYEDPTFTACAAAGTYSNNTLIINHY